MKYSIIFISTFVISVACGTSKKMAVREPAKFKCGKRDYFVINPKNTNDSTFVHFNYCFYNLDNETKILTDSLVKLCIPYNHDTTSAQNKLPVDELYLDCIANSFLSEYVQYAKETDYGSPWYWDASFSFDEGDGSILNMEYSFDLYGGGAHGIYYSTYFPIDIKRNKVIKLADVCSDVQALTHRAEVLFRAQNDINPTESLENIGFWFENNKFKLNENFKITNDSMIFFYNLYEIAPYVMGTFEIEIPLNSVKDILIFN